jgi:hypothetical protein
MLILHDLTTIASLRALKRENYLFDMVNNVGWGRKVSRRELFEI